MSNSNWSASAVQTPTTPAPAKPPGMTLPEAMKHLRQGRKIIHADWQPWCFAVADSDGRIHDQEGDRIELHTVMVLAHGIEDRDWYLYEGPVAAPPVPQPTIEDVPPRLTTVESLEALVAGKRVRQTHPQRGSVWHLRDGYFRSDAGHCCDTISISATDLIQSRYTIEP